MENLLSIQSLSLILLLVGIGLAFSQIRLSGWILGWILLSGALLLQGFRSMLGYVAQHGGVDATTYATANEWMGLGFSLLVVAAMHMMREVFARGRLAAESLRMIGAAAIDAIIVIDNKGSIVVWNQAAQRIFGYSNEEAQGKKLGELIVPERYRVDFENMFRDFGSDGRESVRNTPTDVAGMRKDGTEIVTEYAMSRVTIDGKWHAIYIVRDITARKQAEEQRAQQEAALRESQKMEALGTLAGGVAHDFNNTLAMILGNVELARQDVGHDHPALVSLEEIAKASRRAKDLVQQILAFGRRQKLERKVMSLALVVVESARLVRASLPGKASLSVDCSADTPAVLADPTQVKQILINLCSNAIQAVQDQGRPGVIEVRLNAYDQPQGEVRGQLQPGRYACLTVRDNGPGMDEATRSRVFEPFFTTKKVGKGTGLGLSVVHGMVQAHNGKIEVESSSGEGSTFRIYFPAFEGPLPEDIAARPDPTPIHGKGKHVLYVDDEQAIIFLMQRLLERQGYRVSGYTDPREAVAAARANPGEFDLAVTDYNMPGMSGLEVAQALKEIRADLPVALASGYITEELRAKAPAAGVDELIYKPNTVEDLSNSVARLAQTVGEKSKAS